jgi:hypothetical protein
MVAVRSCRGTFLLLIMIRGITCYAWGKGGKLLDTAGEYCECNCQVHIGKVDLRSNTSVLMERWYIPPGAETDYACPYYFVIHITKGTGITTKLSYTIHQGLDHNRMSFRRREHQ